MGMSEEDPSHLCMHFPFSILGAIGTTGLNNPARGPNRWIMVRKLATVSSATRTFCNSI